MDIKWRSKYLYLIAFIIGSYMVSLSSIATMGFIEDRDCINKSYNEYIRKDPKQESKIFQNELNEYFNSVKTFITDFKGYSQKLNEDKVSENEAEILKKEYDSQLRNSIQGIEEQYKYEIDTAEKQGDKVKLSKLTQEKNKKLEEVRKEKTKTLQDAKAHIIAEKDNEYTYLKAHIEARIDIKYYIKDIKNGEQYTNFGKVPNIEEYIKDKALYSVKLPLEYTSDAEMTYVSNWFFTHKFEGYFIIENQELTNNKEKVYIYNDLQAKYNEYVSLREKTIKEVLISISALVLGTLLILYALRKKAQDTLYIEKIKNLYKKIPLDLRICILIIYSLYMVSYIQKIDFFNQSFSANHIFDLTAIAMYILYLAFNIKYILKLAKDKQEFIAQCKESIIYKLSLLIKESLMIKSIMGKVSIICILTALWGACALVTIIVATDTLILLVLGGCVLLYGVLLLQYILRKVILFNKIIKGTEEIASGNLDYIIEVKEDGNLSKMAHNINNMKDGFKKSVDNEMKSERMKSELITNVSHDLKTPLTSIINYVNLLKKQDISQEERSLYIEVLDRKSQRLKVLIEDLFEASKISSGTVELNIETVDVTALLKQALGELDERIKNSSLTFKVNTPKDKVCVNLDGKKTWRVFENLISNILKYSEPNTRVYIDLIEEENKVVIIMKNISAYEMEFDVSEIFERFKRGDKSRSTEGSGLGLAIAKSIVELQGGQMNIEIDGDLFKVIVEFENRDG